MVCIILHLVSFTHYVSDIIHIVHSCPVCVYIYILFIHSTIDGTWGSFQNLSTTNSAVMNIQILVCICVSVGYI